MEIERLSIPDVLLLTPRRFGDDRGFFSETFNAAAWRQAGLEADFVQDNHAYSAEKGVVRGLHFQLHPSAQGKLVRVPRGAILDVAVDIRRGSPTFGKHVSAVISAENWRQIWVPVGFAHGYVTLTPDAEVIYKVTSGYAPALDRGIRWNDPALGIDWGVTEQDAILSEKDRKQPLFADAPDLFA
jgi:dTDP-4-dehydrorhamnose 3,5-epimerase